MSIDKIIYESHCVLELDLNGKITEVNQNYLNVMGQNSSSLVGQSEDQLNPDGMWDILRKGETYKGEFKRTTANNKEKWFFCTYSPIKDESGKITKVVEIAIDITATKEELKVRTDIMNITSIVSEADLRGDILSINDKFIEVSQYSKDELIGNPHNVTRHPDMPKEVFKEMWATIGRGKIFRGIVKNRAKDGSPYYVDAVIAPLMGENGKP